MTKYLILFPFILLLCWSCEKEDAITASGLDQDHVLDSLDMSYPIVKEYYEKYGVAILTRFDENVDLKFNFYTEHDHIFWNALEIGRITRKSQCDSIMEILEGDILSCFKDEFEFNGKTFRSDFRKKYFPNKILLTNSLVSQSSSYGIATESVNGVGGSLIGALHCVENDNALILNIDTETMLVSEESFQRFRKDMIYVLVAYAITKHKLYDEVPDKFYEYSSNFYEKVIGDIQEENGETVHDVSRYEYVRNYGLVCTSTYPGSSLGFMWRLSFPSKERDFRVFFDHLMTPEGLGDGSGDTHVYKVTEVTLKKMWYVAHTLMNWGIDVTLLNDDPEFLYLIQLEEEQLDNIVVP